MATEAGVAIEAEERTQANSNKTNHNSNNDTLISHPHLILGPHHSTPFKVYFGSQCKNPTREGKDSETSHPSGEGKDSMFPIPPEGKRICVQESIIFIQESLKDLPVGGKLKYFVPQWERRGAHQFQSPQVVKESCNHKRLQQQRQCLVGFYSGPAFKTGNIKSRKNGQSWILSGSKTGKLLETHHGPKFPQSFPHSSKVQKGKA